MTAGELAFLVDAQRRSYARASRSLQGSWPEDALLDATAITQLIARVRYGTLATASADGRAQATPVSYVVTRERLWFATVAGARLRNCRANPWASFLLMSDDEGRHVALRVEGAVTVHDRTSLQDAAPDFDQRWKLRHGGDAPTWAAAFLELAPDVVYSYGA